MKQLLLSTGHPLLISNSRALQIDGSESYTIDNSIMFDGSADYLSRTPSSAGDRKTWTFSTWVKRCGLGTNQVIFSSYTSANDQAMLYFHLDNNLRFDDYTSGYDSNLVTSSLFRDIGAWYHIVLAVDTTQGTAEDRLKLYVNGVEVTSFSATTYPSQNYDGYVNNTIAHYVGTRDPSNFFFNGYLSDTYLIDGSALTPSSFGELDTNGNWQPKAYAGSYGTNGFHLDFSNAADLGNDVSGNGNDWTETSITSANQVSDSPTDNYCVLNALDASLSGSTIDYGNMQINTGAAADTAKARGSIYVNAGKYYWEFVVNAVYTQDNFNVGVREDTTPITENVGGTDAYRNIIDTVATDVIQIAIDLSLGAMWVGKNNTWYNGASEAEIEAGTTTNAEATGISGSFAPLFVDQAGSGSVDGTFNFGQRDFAYTPPSGFLALSTANMPTPVIIKPDEYFDVTTFDSVGTVDLSISNLIFQPDLVWTKNRDQAYHHSLYDSVRGVNKDLQSDTTKAEDDRSNYLNSFDSNGFTLGPSENCNYNSGDACVAWSWKKSALAGFDIVSYTGTGVNRTVAHSLGVAPEMIIIKELTVVRSWNIYHACLTSAAYYIQLNSTAAQVSDTTLWQSTSPTSSVFSIGTDYGVNQNTEDYIAYLFASVEGYSKVGSYEGNGAVDGRFVYCGFRPKYVMIKRSSTSGTDWVIMDNARDAHNITEQYLAANLVDAETTYANDKIDFVSSGFKLRGTPGGINTSGETYIFYAVAETPLKYARAR